MNKVIACFFNTYPDPQRGYRWPADVNLLKKLFDTVPHDQLVILHDCFDDLPVENHRVTSMWPALQQRWHSYHQYLSENSDICYAWLIDATDVQLLNDPWQLKPDVLYMGSVSYENLDTPWVHDHSPTVDQGWLTASRDLMLLNPGTVGGDRGTVIWFCSGMLTEWANRSVVDQCEELVYANMIARSHPSMVTADVCTEFRTWQTSHPTAMWSHK